MDVHVRFVVTSELQLRGVDVLTAQADGAARFPDPVLLDRASALGRVLFSQDNDLLIEATHRQRSGIDYAGVIYAHQQRITVGQCVHELTLIAQAGEPMDFISRVTYLPL